MEINMIAERPHIKTHRQIPTPLQVAGWEARRYWANAASRQLLVIAFILFMLVTWFVRYPANAGFSVITEGDSSADLTFSVSATSAYGMILLLLAFSFLLALILPFLSSGGVAHEVKHRTHELLMTTPVPTWAYVTGRYLFCLLASIGMALLIFAAILLMGLILHFTDQAYLVPQVGVDLSIWAVAILPMTVLISSLSFVLGTLLPRHANLAALIVMITWFLPPLVLLLIPTSGWQVPLWYKTWEPTNIGMSSVLQASYMSGMDGIINNPVQYTLAGGQHAIQMLQSLEQKMPELLPWLLPHFVWAGFGLGLVLLVAFTFKRFRRALNG